MYLKFPDALREHALMPNSQTDFEVPSPVAEAIEEGTTAVRAFRESSGQSQHDVAAGAGITEVMLAAIEQGTSPHGLELAMLADVLDVPVELLVDRSESSLDE